MEKTMNFEKFASVVQEQVKDFLPECFADKQIVVQKMTKIDQTYHGLLIKSEYGTAPVLNLDTAYQEYLDGTPIHQLLVRIASALFRAEENKPEAEDIISMLGSYDQVKNKLFIRLNNAERSKEVIAKAPHKLVEDLVLTYHIKLDLPGDTHEFGSILVTKQILNNYFGVSEKQLHEDAIRNSQEMFPAKIAPITSFLNLEKEDDQSVPIMVLTNQALYGASTLFYPGEMDKMAEIMGGNYFILPSSVHELLAVPVFAAADVAEMKNMVSSINSSIVEMEDQLSNNVYYFDAKLHTFAIA